VSFNKVVESNPGSYIVIINLRREGEGLDFNSSQADLCYRIVGMTQMEEVWSDRIPEDVKQMICYYVPYGILSIQSKKRRRAISVSHFAQSLDGLIADSSGNSKWIGNRENLVHAHRMRAICDGIIIGSRTLESDNPRLNVRHVKGSNPVRIILGSVGDNIDSMLAANSDSIWVIGGDGKLKNSKLRYLSLNRKNKYINCREILKTLYAEGVHSVYIEGGAITTSQFMNDGMIDICQLHFSPIIIGKGVKSMSNLPIDKIDEAIRFSHFTYNHIGKEFMFVGEPIREDLDG